MMKKNKSPLYARRENLLTAWKRECDVLSSPVNVRPVLDRRIVELIYGTLEGFFGLRYFEPAAVGTPLEKVNWLHSLLTNHKSMGCFMAVADIARLLLYAGQLGEAFVQRLTELKKNPDNLRSYFFELYTYRLLDKAGVPNIKKPTVNGQELEGVCTLQGKEYLFECRKLYLPGAEQLDVRMTVQTELLKQLQDYRNAKMPSTGIIFTIQLSNPSDSKNKFVFSQKIAAFFKGAKSRRNPVSLPYEQVDDYGTLRVTDYSLDRAMEVQQVDNHDVYCILYPAASVVPGQPIHHRVGAGVSHYVSQDKIMEKLIDALREKRRQHKVSAYTGKIYFFDNEVLPEFRMALLGQERMLDEHSIQRLMDGREEDEALCIVTRDFRGSPPKFSIRVFCKSSTLKHALEGLTLEC